MNQKYVRNKAIPLKQGNTLLNTLSSSGFKYPSNLIKNNIVRKTTANPAKNPNLNTAPDVSRVDFSLYFLKLSRQSLGLFFKKKKKKLF